MYSLLKGLAGASLRPHYYELCTVEADRVHSLLAEGSPESIGIATARASGRDATVTLRDRQVEILAISYVTRGKLDRPDGVLRSSTVLGGDDHIELC